MAGLDVPLSTLHLSPHEKRRMTRSRTGSLFLRSCRTCICYTHPTFTGAFPDPVCIFQKLRNLNKAIDPGANVFTTAIHPSPNLPMPRTACFHEPFKTTDLLGLTRPGALASLVRDLAHFLRSSRPILSTTYDSISIT
jgi:hypothetical protein